MYNSDDERVINEIFLGRFSTNNDIRLRRFVIIFLSFIIIVCGVLIYTSTT
jgi:hypothetical protein